MAPKKNETDSIKDDSNHPQKLKAAKDTSKLFVRPRGRAPRGENGLEQLWDYTTGAWFEVPADYVPEPPAPESKPSKPSKPPPPSPPAGGAATEEVSLNKHQLPVDIEIYWPGDKAWYAGTIDRVRVEKSGAMRRLHHVSYNDGDKLWHHLATEEWKFARASGRPAKVAKVAKEPKLERSDEAHDDGDAEKAESANEADDADHSDSDSIDGFEIHCSDQPL